MGIHCSDCIVEDMTVCADCIDNPAYAKYKRMRSHKVHYQPTCPRGYCNCVNDPAYIKYTDPEYYVEKYGNKTPEEVSKLPDGCWDSYINDPNEEYYCYDDEDK